MNVGEKNHNTPQKGEKETSLVNLCSPAAETTQRNATARRAPSCADLKKVAAMELNPSSSRAVAVFPLPRRRQNEVAGMQRVWEGENRRCWRARPAMVMAALLWRCNHGERRSVPRHILGRETTEVGDFHPFMDEMMSTFIYGLPSICGLSPSL